ncbi:MAG TPA: YicC family protein [Bacteroidales bacterium]|nr:YicC family protein [Bacteroidales bacterium]
MLKSMTGFGFETGNISGKKVTVEVRALNSRTLDANLRLPARFRSMEAEIRILLSQRIERGKIDLYLVVENETVFSDYKVNRELANHYLNELKMLGSEAGLPLSADLLPAILRLPDVVTQTVTEISEQEKQAVLELAEAALHKVDATRSSEGQMLEKDFQQRINTIMQLLHEIEPHESRRTKMIRQRLRSDLAAIEQRVQIDNNRFEQEIIYYLEKTDFTEEKLRLKKHCIDFLQTMSEDVSQGRKLGFISQEIGREINTLGSKANDADIQKIVVSMKNELEKIKEQLLNIL